MECWRRCDKRARRLHTTGHPGPRLQASLRSHATLCRKRRRGELTGIDSEIAIPPLPCQDSWPGCTLGTAPVSDESKNKDDFHFLQIGAKETLTRRRVRCSGSAPVRDHKHPGRREDSFYFLKHLRKKGSALHSQWTHSSSEPLGGRSPPVLGTGGTARTRCR